MGGGRGIGGVLEGLERESFSGVDRGVRPLAELRQGGTKDDISSLLVRMWCSKVKRLFI